MGSIKANLLLTDPPYSVSIVGRTEDKLTIQNDSMDDSHFFEFILSAFWNVVPHMAEGGSAYICSAPNTVVLDTFGGSGSTLNACEETDRVCRMMELDLRYASVIVARYHMAYPDEAIAVLRDGQELSYEEVARSVGVPE